MLPPTSQHGHQCCIGSFHMIQKIPWKRRVTPFPSSLFLGQGPLRSPTQGALSLVTYITVLPHARSLRPLPVPLVLVSTGHCAFAIYAVNSSGQSFVNCSNVGTPALAPGLDSFLAATKLDRASVLEGVEDEHGNKGGEIRYFMPQQI